MISSTVEVARLRQKYPANTKIRLIKMSGEDPKRMYNGLMGKVIAVDDAGQIHVSWENGSSLALVSDVDEFEIVKE